MDLIEGMDEFIDFIFGVESFDSFDVYYFVIVVCIMLFVRGCEYFCINVEGGNGYGFVY